MIWKPVSKYEPPVDTSLLLYVRITGVCGVSYEVIEIGGYHTEEPCGDNGDGKFCWHTRSYQLQRLEVLFWRKLPDPPAINGDYLVSSAEQFPDRLIAVLAKKKKVTLLHDMKDDKSELITIFNDLTVRDRCVIWRRFGIAGSEPEMLETVGKSISVTRERIRQIEVKALRKLSNCLYPLDTVLEEEA